MRSVNFKFVQTPYTSYIMIFSLIVISEIKSILGFTLNYEHWVACKACEARRAHVNFASDPMCMFLIQITNQKMNLLPIFKLS